MLSFPETYHLIPGFIDLHVHGANNKDVMDATQDALSILSKTLAAEGTTSYLATTMTATPNEIEKALCAVNAYMQEQDNILGASILGVHLEGPFISPKKIGAQNAKNLLQPDVALLAEWQKKSGYAIKLVTLAPELPHSLELIRYLREHDIIPSIGHSDATYVETEKAIKEGCHYVTHLFNAMRGIQHREPGVVTAALLSKTVTTELIVDGIHLHPAIVKLALNLKGIEQLVLVTDAMRAKCLGNGSYDLGGQEVHVKEGVATLANGTLAGSTLKMPDAIRKMISFTHCDFYDAVRMASENPAKVLRVFEKKGSIAVGKDADLVVLDNNFCVVMTIVGGKVVHQIY
ncbi:MAG: N-acetylglucosamine-6-phosphate deacetylase [Gammaproteobacteria bacterium]|nr:N-acetylglucosamine-6-phosphate deacetylase [Gammaproteobacteria bacterium]